MVWFLQQQKKRAIEQGHFSTVDLRPAPVPQPTTSILPAPDPAVGVAPLPAVEPSTPTAPVSPAPSPVAPAPLAPPPVDPAPLAPTAPGPQGTVDFGSGGFLPPAVGGTITGGVAKDFLSARPLNRHSRLPGPEMGARRGAIGRILSKRR